MFINDRLCCELLKQKVLLGGDERVTGKRMNAEWFPCKIRRKKNENIWI